MKYFFDFEFEEKSYHNGVAIEIISLGITDLNGNNLYLVNKDYNWYDCKNKWLLENVRPYLNVNSEDIFEKNYYVNFNDFKNILIDYFNETSDGVIELYGYFADYDHVCLSSIFGRMIDLPEFMPMYTKDLKQYCDDLFLTEDVIKDECPLSGNEHCSLDDAKWNKELYSFIQSVSEDFINI